MRPPLSNRTLGIIIALCRNALLPWREQRTWESIAGEFGVTPGRIGQIAREIRVPRRLKPRTPCAVCGVPIPSHNTRACFKGHRKAAMLSRPLVAK